MTLSLWLRHSLADPPPARLWAAALVALCLALVAPLLLVEVPPLLDYPNHLARMVVLANPADPELGRFYAPHWGIIPDLGIDLVLPPLLHLLPVHLAGRLVVAAVVLLPVLGSVAYGCAVFGQRGWWSLGAGLVAWNQASLLGFLNFTAGIGLGMLLAAAWIAWRERYPARILALAGLGAIGLFFCHLMGLVCCVLLIAPYELIWLWRHRRQAPVRLLADAALLLIPLLLYLRSPLGHLPGGAAFLSAQQKLVQLLVPFEGYVLRLDIISAAAVLVVLLAGRPRAVRVSGLTLALLALLYVVAPFGFQGVAHLDARFVIILGFLLFAAVRVTLNRATGLLLVALFAVRMGVLAAAWAGHAADLAQLRAVIAQVPPGATVAIAVVTPRAAPAYWAQAPIGRRLSSGVLLDDHLPALLPIERHAFWPLLFDNDSQQPVTTRPPYRALALQVGGLLDADALGAADLCGYDDLLLLDAGGAADPAHLDPRLTLLDRTDFAALYRVDQHTCGGT